MAWKKCTIQDAIDRWSFSDQYGLSYFSVKSVELKIGENWKDLLDVYKKIDNDYIKLDYKIDKNFFDFNFYKSLLDLELANRIYNQRYEKITLKEINIKINFELTWYCFSAFLSGSGPRDYISCEIKLNNAKDFEKIDFLNNDEKVDFWIPVDIKSDDLPSKYSPLSTQIYSPPVHYFNKPHIQDVQVGDKYYYPPRNSICEVVKKYDSSDPSNKLYDVKLTDGTIV
ncbi:MAG TPA: hypothetical protein PKM32_02900, partial [Planctomycetota bacterium]|nr:hypothetical protein [Planctomycetota bacterium]